MTIQRVGPFDVFYWNPWALGRWVGRHGFPRLGRRLRFGPRVNNFGDLLGPRVAAGVLAADAAAAGPPTQRRRLLTVGSALQFAQDGDIIWGTGRHGDIPPEMHTFTALDVRAVRGPLTREFLLERGIDCPEVYGDPALLLPILEPRWAQVAKRHAYTVVPNLHEWQRYRRHPQAISPRAPLDDVLERIAASDMVVGSSLHGAIIAESLGIPAAIVAGPGLGPVRYLDYYAGTGRQSVPLADNVDAALKLIASGDSRISSGTSGWSPGPLLSAFPKI
ncbi:MAG: polysaccharide pyruvyl transferase family protein [Propionibacteriaceae bacterium]|nr:polysaccharide pyruvyl transferase family protein [Propionibacteriaceae bacterium]